jgi:hypothetical protein
MSEVESVFRHDAAGIGDPQMYFERPEKADEATAPIPSREYQPDVDNGEDEFDIAFNNFVGGINEALGRFHAKFQAYAMDVAQLDEEMQIFIDQLSERQDMNEQSKAAIQSDVIHLQEQLSDVLGTLQDISETSADEV